MELAEQQGNHNRMMLFLWLTLSLTGLALLIGVSRVSRADSALLCPLPTQKDRQCVKHPPVRAPVNSIPVHRNARRVSREVITYRE